MDPASDALDSPVMQNIGIGGLLSCDSDITFSDTNLYSILRQKYAYINKIKSNLTNNKS